MAQSETIAAGRAAARMSQEHLAKAAGISVRTVIRAERGDSVSGESMRAISAVLGLDVTAIAPPEAPRPSWVDLWRDSRLAMDARMRKEDVEALFLRAGATVEHPRAVLTPDVPAMRTAINNDLGLKADTSGVRRHYLQLRLQQAAWIPYILAVAAAIYGVYVRLIESVGPEATLAYFSAALLGALAYDEYLRNRLSRAYGRMRQSSRTLFVLDATHLHEFRSVRHPKAMDAAAAVHHRSIRTDGFVSLARVDAHGWASFEVSANGETIRMPYVVPGEVAGGIGDMLGGTGRPAARKAISEPARNPVDRIEALHA